MDAISIAGIKYEGFSVTSESFAIRAKNGDSGLIVENIGQAIIVAVYTDSQSNSYPVATESTVTPSYF
eukprot:gene8050-9458_t